jgi:DNA invertase Pin-like site-specific DNA recombinase
MRMRTAFYLRVSTDDQTLEPQRLELVRFCETRKWLVGQEFSDVLSGAKSERPGLRELMQGVRTKQFDAVLCVKIDRLARSLSHFFALVDEMSKYGVALVVTSQGIDTTIDSPMRKMQLQILGVFAEFERGLIRERTKAGLAVARANGKTLGRPSPSMVENKAEVIAAWRAETGGSDYRLLAARLGGVSTGTAHRLANAKP